ncbi:MAG: hypothetical protein IAE93_08655 [Ignavibacteria bacterium]|nr:hypothetical protein [Ignavibacteria bacterium]
MMKLFNPEEMTEFEKSLKNADAIGVWTIHGEQIINMELLLKSIESDVLAPDYFGDVVDPDDGNLQEATDMFLKSRGKFNFYKAMGEYEPLFKAISDEENAWFSLPDEAKKFYLKEDN